MTKRAILVSLAAVMLGGCAVWVDVAPQQLLRLSDKGQARVGSQGTGNVYTEVIVQMQRPDGRLFEVRNTTTVRLTMGSKIIYFYSPVRAQISGDDITISSSNFPPKRIPLASITKVEVVL